MIAFWIAAALLSAATAGLIVYRGARAARRLAGIDQRALWRRTSAGLSCGAGAAGRSGWAA